MQILIVGAGVAGLTLAGLLRQRGLAPLIIEREDSITTKGYMLGLYPLGSRVLHGLGLYPSFLSRSVSMSRYEIGNGRGELIREYDLTPISDRFGPIQGISRGELINVLLEGVKDTEIRFSTTVETLNQHHRAVEVAFNDGNTGNFDLVVGADGMHSQIRKLVLKEHEYPYRDTGWGGWVYWADLGQHPQETYTEYWVEGRFLGLYSVKQRLGVFLGGLVRDVEKQGLAGVAAQLDQQFPHPIPALRAALTSTDDAFFWKFHDCRVKHWQKGRIVLLGDAAVGFLPTAGVGASMAMESAAALNDELSRADAAHVERALSLYEKRHRGRVERAQTSSRRLGRLMFVKSRPISWARNRILKLYSVERLVKDLARIMEEPI